MDITLEVIVVAPTHTVSAEKAANRYEAGDIVDVYPSADHAEWTGSEYRIRGGISTPRTGFIHITGVPDRPMETVRRRLTKVFRDRDNMLVQSPTGSIIKQRAWRIPPSSVPATVRNRLQSQREITVTWAQVKSYAVNKIDGASLTDVIFDG